MNQLSIAIGASKKLLAFFNANTAGATVQKFADRKTAERRCGLLAEELQAEKFSDADIAAAICHGTKLEHVEDSEEDSVDHSASNAVIATIAQPVKRSFAELAEHKYTQGSLRHKLSQQVAEQQPIAPRPKKADNPSAPKGERLVITAVCATFAGTSKPQAASVRAAVLKAVQDAPDHTMTVAALDAQFQCSTRGYLQKLLEKSHLVTVVAGSAA